MPVWKDRERLPKFPVCLDIVVDYSLVDDRGDRYIENVRVYIELDGDLHEITDKLDEQDLDNIVEELWSDDYPDDGE